MNMKLEVKFVTADMIEECVDLFIDTFTREPWLDVYDSRQQVVDFFQNHLRNNYFIGYVGVMDGKIVAISIGIKKPWIQGMEYYIDEFCVSHTMQGQGIGSIFLSEIEKEIKKLGMNGMILNTEIGFPSHRFYEKNGFKVIEDMIILAK